ncbi:unnamed protein product [Phytophthora fragariaefolia]|uniref:Unnamed protein product n=1 Tax=Phytophthora fragariaefolia TaxID=1490495 RepID=A0A9W6X1C3_9STRA|nr:unnamed protein product [Phytophthora fragariaefolia]
MVQVYVCTHGYKRVSRSGGSRPRQNVRYTDCKARFTACVTSELPEEGGENLFIKVTGQHLVHSDHPVSLEQWRMYAQNRAAVIEHPYLSQEADLMRRFGSNKKAARAHIEALTGKVCTMKDMHNLYARLKTRDKSARLVTARQTRQPLQTASSRHVNSAVPESITASHSGASIARAELLLQSFVDADVENHASILAADDGSNEAICLASRSMKEHFQVFPELLILDATTTAQSKTQADQYLLGFLSMDMLGNAKPVFLARALVMPSSLLRRVCQDFKRTHPKWVQIKVLVMSELMPDVVQVLTVEFPEARVLLCQVHVLQRLHDLAGFAKIPDRISIRDKVRESFQNLVFAHSESRYNEAKSVLVRRLIASDERELLDTFDRKWEPYRGLWVSYMRAEQFDFSAILTQGTNSYWEPIQRAFKRARDNIPSRAPSASRFHPLIEAAAVGASATIPSKPFQPAISTTDSQESMILPSNSAPLIVTYRGEVPVRGVNNSLVAQCMPEVLTTIKYIETEWTSKMLILELTKPVAMGHHDPLLLLLVNCISSFAVNVISSQLMIHTSSVSGSVTVTKTRPAKTPLASGEPSDLATSLRSSAAEATVRWLNKTTREKHILQHDGSSCDCEFFVLYQLPCRHLIWYEVVVLQHKQLSMAAVGQRWLLRSFQMPKLRQQRESNEIEYHLL